MHPIEQAEPFVMAQFFQVYFDMAKAKTLPAKKKYQKPFLLPDTSDLLLEDRFADVSSCYNGNGIGVSILVNKPFEDVSFPQVTYGDSLELFIDTRDLKSARILHKFCHHFVFFPKDVAGVQAMELTKFRGDDTHELCQSSDLHVSTTFHKKSYEMDVWIDQKALFGFDPSRFDRLGFSYRINQKKGESQHFNVSSKDATFEKHPNLWGTFNLLS